MALPFDITSTAHDPRALTILAKTIYRELRAEGYAAGDVMAVASELLELVASEVKDRRDGPASSPREIAAPRVEAPVEIPT
jgi:hypothetical protein